MDFWEREALTDLRETLDDIWDVVTELAHKTSQVQFENVRLGRELDKAETQLHIERQIQRILSLPGSRGRIPTGEPDASVLFN